MNASIRLSAHAYIINWFILTHVNQRLKGRESNTLYFYIYIFCV